MRDAKSNQNFKLNAKQQAALLIAGFRLYKASRLRDARKIFKGLAVLDPKNPYVLGILGSIDQKEKNFHGAIDRYSEALALYPEDPNLLANRGESYLRVGKLQNAAADLRKAIDLDHDNKHPASNRARLLVHAVQTALETAKEKRQQG